MLLTILKAPLKIAALLLAFLLLLVQLACTLLLRIASLVVPSFIGSCHQHRRSGIKLQTCVCVFQS